MNIRPPGSIRQRLTWVTTLVLVGVLAGAGVALQEGMTESLRTQRQERLQTLVYALLSGAEVDAQGALHLPSRLPDPRLDLPGSGLAAQVSTPDGALLWRSPSALGLRLPPIPASDVGQWHFALLPQAQPTVWMAQLGVRWAVGDTPQHVLVFSVFEDEAVLARARQAFERTLWAWLAGSAAGAVLTLLLALRWGLRPLQTLAAEVQAIEAGAQSQIGGVYPRELNGLAQRLNTLIAQEHGRQLRYKQALDDLAHSLKTPLAVLRAAAESPHSLASTVREQVQRMDHIVVHQLGRAAALGARTGVSPLALAPLVTRVVASLHKVYADKNLLFEVNCAEDIRWPLDEGDAFEVLGNLLDNAAKWARQRVRLSAQRDPQGLTLRVEDDGPGFPDGAALPARGRRLDEQTPGHGIGLAVVQDVLHSYGGTLTLSRSSLGGAQVCVQWPRT
ncbi:MAG: ATP-binding protein [Rhodoferax sp.]